MVSINWIRTTHNVFMRYLERTKACSCWRRRRFHIICYWVIRWQLCADRWFLPRLAKVRKDIGEVDEFQTAVDWTQMKRADNHEANLLAWEKEVFLGFNKSNRNSFALFKLINVSFHFSHGPLWCNKWSSLGGILATHQKFHFYWEEFICWTFIESVWFTVRSTYAKSSSKITLTLN